PPSELPIRLRADTRTPLVQFRPEQIRSLSREACLRRRQSCECTLKQCAQFRLSGIRWRTNRLTDRQYRQHRTQNRSLAEFSMQFALLPLSEGQALRPESWYEAIARRRAPRPALEA